MSCNTQGSVPTVRIPFETATQKPFVKQGDTIPANSFSAPDWGFDLTAEGITINIQLFFNRTQQVASYSVGNGITITNATTFVIDRVLANNFPAGTLTGDCQISWLDGGERLTKTFFNVEYIIIKEFTKV